MIVMATTGIDKALIVLLLLLLLLLMLVIMIIVVVHGLSEFQLMMITVL